MKELAGNPGKRPLNRREPKLASTLPPCPRHLSAEAKREWRRMGGELARMGVVTAVDRAALAAYCQAWARWVDAEGQVARLGTIVKTANGNLIQNPYLAVANRALEQMTRLAAEFGMTPSSRSRVQVAARDDEPTLADILFGDAADRIDMMEMADDGDEEEHANR